MPRVPITILSLSVLAMCVAESLLAQQPIDDPLADILKPELRPMVEVVLDTYRVGRKYTDDDFPLPASEFSLFKKDVTNRFVATLGLEDWTVSHPNGKQSSLAGKFVDQHLKTIRYHDLEMEVHVIKLPGTGLSVPAVLCLPATKKPQPGVCVFSGHTHHGLRDLLLDLNSYQRGIAVRLAKAGLVTIAVEKIDTGYLSRDGQRGIDEDAVATFGLYWGRPTRAHQLMACIAASEILAAHPRVDETRIGATGVSLGGWLSMQTALLSQRIKAVADWGVKTVTVPPDSSAAEFKGMADLCHILPGMLSVCDRNLMSLAYCPRPLLAGHGSRHKTSHSQGPLHYRDLYSQQYAHLGYSDRYEYHVHDGGDTMPIDVTINYFRRQFGVR